MEEMTLKHFFQDVIFALGVGLFIAFVFFYVLPAVSARVGYDEKQLQDASRVNAYDEYLERKANAK